jgi:hypothetical protein
MFVVDRARPGGQARLRRQPKKAPPFGAVFSEKVLYSLYY